MEMALNEGRGAAGSNRIVCKKCRAPFGPDDLQRELQSLPIEPGDRPLGQKRRLRAVPVESGRDWRVMETGSFHRLKCWIRNYLGDEYFWDLQLVLRKEEAPVSQLGRAGRLGQTIWPKTDPPKKDLDDLIIHPE